MRKFFVGVAAGIAIFAGNLCGFGATKLAAQDAANPPYLDTKLSPEERARDLVGRMTLEEKASQMVDTARAIPRLNVPAYMWWSEALHGVLDNGVTEFPEPIGLAATFDVPAVHAMAIDIGIEARIKHVQDQKEGRLGTGGGLDFWAPNLNLFRDPRWGRGQETYGEDPYVIGRMGVAFVTGLQGDDPNHLRAIATPKHFFVHSGPEPTRHFADVDVSRHDEQDTYEPGFRAAIVEGHAGSVMCAYNGINGQPACANEYSLDHLLRGAWGFEGYVVSDCGAVTDIFTGHHYRPTQAEATAISVERGMDNECNGGSFGAGFTVNENQYKAYVDAVQQGYLSETVLDTALLRLFTARIKLGMFDPPELDPYAKIDEKDLDSAAHRAMALKMADESMVLLKNDGTLPLKAGIMRIAVVGPLAEQTGVMLGNYTGRPNHTVSLLEGLRAEFPNAKIDYVPGTQFLNPDGNPIPNSLLTSPDGKPGLKADYAQVPGGFGRGGFGGFNAPLPAPFLSRVEANASLTADHLPGEVKGRNDVAVRWTGFLTPADTGDYLIGVRANGLATMLVDGKQVTQGSRGLGMQTRMGTVHLTKGEKVELSIQYRFPVAGGLGSQAAAQTPPVPSAQLIWAPVSKGASPEAVAAAKSADVVIAAVGITSQLEGEEMQVNLPGFLGGDRTSIDLPQQEEDLVEGVAATGKPVVVVVLNGSALAVNWIDDHANAVLEAWYAGEEGGNAIAATLSGKNNPAGRLPVTFYKGVDQLPNFENYSMQNRTYRYFTGKPLYPFGYGLSYTTFGYSNLQLPRATIHGGDPLDASVTVTNNGKVAGDEVAELYLTFPDVAGAPLRALRGFERIHLEPGASRNVEFHLNARDLSMVTSAGDIIVAKGKYTITIGGGQPGSDAPSAAGSFEVNGQIVLPD